MNAAGEILFRIVLGVIWVLYFGVRLYFQGKVRGVVDYVRVNEKQEKLLYKLFAFAYLILPFYFITSWLDFAHFTIPIWLRAIGGLLTCLGVGLFGWAHQVLGLNWTAVLALSNEHQLVTDGPYRYVRHPIYTAFFIIGFGFLFLSANWLIGITYIGPLLVLYVARVSLEEKMMIERFGDAYRNYMQKAGRLFPRFRV